MRILVAAAAAAALLGVSSFAGVAAACGPYAEAPPVASPRPAESPQRLLRAAAELDAQAFRDDLAARTASRRASDLEGRASRSELLAARLPWGRERSRLLADADHLRHQAGFARAEAEDGFLRASALRDEANELRAQARRLAGGWRARPIERGAMI